MKYTVHDKKYNYKYFFDTETGLYMRTGILDENGRDIGEEKVEFNKKKLVSYYAKPYCMNTSVKV